MRDGGKTARLLLGKLTKQNLRVFQIERIEAFGEPAIDRSKKLASLIPFPLVAPEPRHAHCCAEFPRLCLLLWERCGLWASTPNGVEPWLLCRLLWSAFSSRPPVGLGGGIVAGHSSTGHGTAARRATIWTARLTWSHAAARVA